MTRGWFGGAPIFPEPNPLAGLSREELERAYFSILSMLEGRATFLDRWLARRKPGHWLNRARRELEDRPWPPWRR